MTLDSFVAQVKPASAKHSWQRFAVRVGLIVLWLILGALWGIAFGRMAIGSEQLPIDTLMELFGEEKIGFGMGYSSASCLLAFFKLIVALSIIGNIFWFARRVSRGTELAYHSFVAVLWIGLLAFCPLPRMAEESAGITQLVYTRSAYAILGDGFSSVFRNYMTPFVLACVGTGTILVRATARILAKTTE
jgi:hypothetical protein